MKQEEKTSLVRPILRDYARQLLPEIPVLIRRLTVEDWQRSLGIIYNKHVNNPSSIGNEQMPIFISNFLDVLKTKARDEIHFYLDELEKIKQKIHHESRDTRVNLEMKVIEYIEDSKGFTRQELSDLNEIFFNMSDYARFNFSRAPEFFDGLKKELRALPQKYRTDAIACAKKVLTANYEEEKEIDLTRIERSLRRKTISHIETRCRLVLSSVKSIGQNINTLQDKFPEWIDSALDRHQSIKGLSEYFNDPHNYFDHDLEKTVGGLPLTEVYGILFTYVHALTGRNIKIKKSDSNDLACSFKEETLFLPPTMNKGRDDIENFSLYKALASYESGAIMFGTYTTDTNVLSSFTNPDFARSIYGFLELARIDYRLKEKFPGLRDDLQFFKRILKNRTKDSDERSKCLENILDYVFLDKKYGLDKEIAQELDDLNPNMSESTSEDSLIITQKIYSILERKMDLSKEKPLEAIIDMTPEIFIEEEKKKTVLVAVPEKPNEQGKRFRYNEWDYSTDSYKENFVQVVEVPYPDALDNDFLKNLFEKNGLVIEQLKRNFLLIRPEELERIKKQYSGDIDYDLVVRARAEINSGITPSEKLFVREYKNQRSVASMVLSEDSGSLRKFLDINNPELRIIDIIKQSQIYFSVALESLGDRYALATFSGETEKNVEFYLIKSFERDYGPDVQRLIGSLRPLKQNRDGAGIRHATRLLLQQPEQTRLLFYLMEGIPHDFGYQGDYAIEDTKKALIEARNKGCIPVVLAFGKEIDKRVHSLGDCCFYRETNDPSEVPELLPRLYRKITY